jgi:hypothetical protein
MKRFLIFLLLGPFLGFTVFIIRDIAGGMIFGGPMGFLFGLPFAYLFGLPVALTTWVEDWWLADKISLPVKVLTSACVGYVAVIAILLMAATRRLSLHECLTFGIVGAIPAAICSWLAGFAQQKRQEDNLEKPRSAPDGAGR